MRALDTAVRALLAAAALGLAAPAWAGAAAADTLSEGAAPPAPVLVEKQRVILRGLDFGFDTAYIQPVSAGTLEAVAEGLKLRPDVHVRIEGYTDSVGTEPYNRELSLERAEAVKRILVGFGIDPKRLEAVGLDESRPIASNDTEEGRAMNRRVELVLLEAPLDL
jgi:outer membrane protein OmpA-like peptidoglycan-associated protein